MAKIIIFTPKRYLDAQANLAGFIDMAQTQLRPFGENLDFESNEWDVTTFAYRRGTGTQRIRVHFSTLETAAQKKAVFMAEPFLSFAKAYVYHESALNPSIVTSHLLLALRVIESSLAENGITPDPTKLNLVILNRAAQIAQEKYRPTTAYTVGRLMANLAKFVCENGLVNIPFRWKNSIKRPSSTGRIGKQFNKRRAEKMLSQAALEALPQIFRMAKHPADVIISSTAAILCAAPSRICELFDLPVDCEVIREYGPENKQAYYLRWHPAKGAEPMLKQFTPEFVDVVKEAISNIRQTTETARKAAKWYEQHPDQIYLPDDLKYLRDQEWLTEKEVTYITGIRDAGYWFKYTAKIPVSQKQTVKFKDVEKKILSMLPENFPIASRHTGLKYSEALFVVLRDQMNIARTTKPCMIEAISMNTINYGLGARKKHCGTSIFSRFDFTEPDGSPIQMTTHQFRHYLNTLAQSGGMSQIEIAKWSGRSNVHQNQTYDHVSADEMLQITRDAIGKENEMFGPLAELPKNLPMSRADYATLRIPTAHILGIGFCVHDYMMSPCQKFRNCIRCEDLVCVKGDRAKTIRLRECLEDLRTLLKRAEEAEEEKYAGSEVWVEHHKETVSRYEQLCDFMDNPDIPVGTVIQLAPPETDKMLPKSNLALSSKNIRTTTPKRRFKLN